MEGYKAVTNVKGGGESTMDPPNMQPKLATPDTQPAPAAWPNAPHGTYNGLGVAVPPERQPK
jgi:hypothetical protein